MVVVGCGSYYRALSSCQSDSNTRKVLSSTYNLAILCEIDRRMVRREDIIGGSNHGARHVDKLLLLLITKSDGKSCGSRRSEEGYQQSIWTC